MDLKSRALDMLENARDSLDKGRFWLTCFSAHQAVELYLKGVLFELAGAYPFTHDLRVLMDSLGEDIPDEILEALDYLNPLYSISLSPLDGLQGEQR